MRDLKKTVSISFEKTKNFPSQDHMNKNFEFSSHFNCSFTRSGDKFHPEFAVVKPCSELYHFKSKVHKQFGQIEMPL